MDFVSLKYDFSFKALMSNEQGYRNPEGLVETGSWDKNNGGVSGESRDLAYIKI